MKKKCKLNYVSKYAQMAKRLKNEVELKYEKVCIRMSKYVTREEFKEIEACVKDKDRLLKVSKGEKFVAGLIFKLMLPYVKDLKQRQSFIDMVASWTF